MRCRWSAGVVWAVGVILVLGGSAAAEQLRLPPDLEYTKAGGSPGKVVFSHQSHVAYADKCTACHIQVFRMLQPTRQVTHTAMEKGASCGTCHNGQMAFGPTDPAACTRCHVGEGKPS